MGGLEKAADAADGWLALFPTVLLVWIVVMAFWTLILNPAASSAEGESARLEKENQNAEAEANSRELIAAVSTLCSAYDDWLDTSILMLTIDCAGHPADSQRAELLAELIAARKTVASLFIHLDNPAVEMPDVDPAEIAKQWDSYKQQFRNLPPLKQVA